MSKKSILFIVFLFVLYFIFYSVSYSHSVSDELESNIFRLHVIANSDSSEDQELKLFIRDRLVEYLSQFSFDSKEDLISFLHSNKGDVESVIRDSISSKGFSYDFSIEIGNSFFPKKDYGNMSMPSGFYDGLKVKLGRAEGKNWWCVLFPPMCLIDSSTCSFSEDSESILEDSLDDETFSVLFSETPEYKFKFKIVDFINGF